MVFPNQASLPKSSSKNHLHEASYYHLNKTSGLWQHKWCPIMFTLIVDNFGIEYVGIQRTQYLQDNIKSHYDIVKNWKGNLYSGIIDSPWTNTTTLSSSNVTICSSNHATSCPTKPAQSSMEPKHTIPQNGLCQHRSQTPALYWMIRIVNAPMVLFKPSSSTPV